MLTRLVLPSPEELTLFLTLKWEIGNSALFGVDFGGSGPLKKELRA